MEQNNITIYESSSYICCLDLRPHQLKNVAGTAEKMNVRLCHVTSVDDFYSMINKVKLFVFCILNFEKLNHQQSSELLNQIKNIPCKYRFLNPNKLQISTEHSSCEFPESSDTWEEEILKSIDHMLPAKFHQLVTFSMNSLKKYSFPEFKHDFYFHHPMEKFDYDYIISCQTKYQDILGLCYLRINLNNFISNMPSNIVQTEEKILDFSRELLNQFWGIINHNIRKTGVESEVGLPTIIDKNGNVNLGRIYIPTVDLRDKGNVFSLKTGFINIKGGKLFDLKDVEFDYADAIGDNIEFL
ncbi:MAG: hypothetical protein HQK49_03065 [Oligoflexia bacterium]|nr:hypothetical protein [Oligoflexia bacterium]